MGGWWVRLGVGEVRTYFWWERADAAVDYFFCGSEVCGRCCCFCHGEYGLGAGISFPVLRDLKIDGGVKWWGPSCVPEASSVSACTISHTSPDQGTRSYGVAMLSQTLARLDGVSGAFPEFMYRALVTLLALPRALLHSHDVSTLELEQALPPTRLSINRRLSPFTKLLDHLHVLNSLDPCQARTQCEAKRHSNAKHVVPTFTQHARF